MSNENPNPPNSDGVPYLSPYESPLPGDAAAPTVDQFPAESLSWTGRLSWLIVLLVMTAMITLTAFARSTEETRTEATTSDLFPVQLQARSMVGQKEFLGGLSGRVDVPAEASEESEANEDSVSGEDQKNGKGPITPVPPQLNSGTYEQRLCYVILINEAQGIEKATERLEELDADAAKAGFSFSEDQSRLREIVGNMLDSQSQGNADFQSVTSDDRDFLIEKLGWTGELALVPEGTRNRETRKELLSEASWSFGWMMALFCMLMLCLFIGIALLAVATILVATRKIIPRFAPQGRSLNIYIETFAVWMVFFFGGPQLAAIALAASGTQMSTTMEMAMSAGFFFGSLCALAWPIFRGIRFSQLCNDIGLKIRGSFIDTLLSPVAYITGLPLMAFGLICVGILTFLASLLTPEKPFGTSIAASHPIQEMIAGGSVWAIGYVVLMACVAAPIVEEIMFRGVLYRHLRELSSGFSRWISVGFSAVFNGLIFAAIHPQGFTAIPLLAVLAINFSLIREWRDSLIAPIIMHAINNGSVTLFMVLLMS